MFSKKGKKEGRKGEGRKEWEKGRRWDRKKERKEKERFRIDIPYLEHGSPEPQILEGSNFAVLSVPVVFLGK